MVWIGAWLGTRVRGAVLLQHMCDIHPAGSHCLLLANPGADGREPIPSPPATLNVVDDFGAAGDGVTDDTAALQVGCGSTPHQCSSSLHTAYRISKCVTLRRLMSPGRASCRLLLPQRMRAQKAGLCCCRQAPTFSHSS